MKDKASTSVDQPYRLRQPLRFRRLHRHGVRGPPPVAPSIGIPGADIGDSNVSVTAASFGPRHGVQQMTHLVR
jgi:hypothetical protein